MRRFRLLSEPAPYLRRYGHPPEPYRRPEPPRIPSCAPQRQQARAYEDGIVTFGEQAAMSRAADERRRRDEDRNLERCRTLGTCEGEAHEPFWEE